MNKQLTFLLSLTFLFLFGCGVEVKKEFYDSGELKSETYWKDGKQEGLKTYSYESGKKKYELPWKNGKQEGIRKEWDEEGKLTFQGNFVNGVEEIK